MEGLVVQLDNYSRLGIPKLQHLTVFPDPAEDLVEEALYSLEDNWTDIVERHADLSEQLKYFIQSPHFTFTFIFTPGP